MRHIRLPAAMAALLLIGLGNSCSSSSEPATGPDKLTITTSVKPREVRDYRIDAVVKGKALVPEIAEPVDLDAAFALKVRHQYSRREGDGLLPLDISLLEGQVTLNQVQGQGQKLHITPSLYPKLTVLIDRDWRITDILGMSSSRIAQTIPGISYGNHIMLFYLQGGDQPRAPGDKWEWSVKIPSLGETYNFASTLVSEQVVDGVRAAVVRQEIVRPAKDDPQGQSSAMKATAESAFAIDDGRLLKSHVECEVTFGRKSASESKPTSRQDNAALRANIKVDISLAKPLSF